MHLNEFGLWRWQANDPHANDDDVPEDGYWELVKSESEQEILEELALEYVEPERRNFGFVFGQKAEKRRKKAAR
jgi:DNA polymerase beta